MMTVQCPSCSKMYNVPETMAGKQVRCKKCGMVFAIASDAQAPGAPAEAGAAGAAAEAASAQQQAPTGPVSTAAREARTTRATAGSGSKSMVLIGAGAVGLIALAAVAYFVVIPMLSGGGQPGWTRPLVPEGTKFMALVDVASVSESDLFAEVKKLIQQTTGQSDLDKMIQQGLAGHGLTTKLKVDDIQSMFVAGSMSGPVPKMVLGVRLSRAMSLNDVISGTGVTKKTYQDYEYVTLGEGRDQMNLARIDETTLCAAPTEAMLKKALDRVKTGDTVSLDGDLSAMVDSVSGKTTFFAMDASAMAGMPGMGPMSMPPGMNMKGMGFGLNVNGSVDAIAVVAFGDSDEAEKMASQLDAALSMAKAMAPEEFKGWVEDIDVSQSGSRVEISVSIDTDEIIAQFGKLKGMIPMGGGGPDGGGEPSPRPTPGPPPGFPRR